MTRWRRLSVVWMIAVLWVCLAATQSMAACCSCSCITPGDFCVDVAENECTDACGNETPPCGFFGWSENAMCSAGGCVAPSTTSAPVASFGSVQLFALGLLGLGLWSIRRRLPHRA